LAATAAKAVVFKQLTAACAAGFDSNRRGVLLIDNLFCNYHSFSTIRTALTKCKADAMTQRLQKRRKQSKIADYSGGDQSEVQ
jgi:hypothetical protein